MCLRYTQNLSHLNQQATMRNNQPHGTVLRRQHAHLHVPNLKGGPLAAGAQGHGEHSGRGSPGLGASVNKLLRGRGRLSQEHHKALRMGALALGGGGVSGMGAGAGVEVSCELRAHLCRSAPALRGRGRPHPHPHPGGEPLWQPPQLHNPALHAGCHNKAAQQLGTASAAAPLPEFAPGEAGFNTE